MGGRSAPSAPPPPAPTGPSQADLDKAAEAARQAELARKVASENATASDLQNSANQKAFNAVQGLNQAQMGMDANSQAQNAAAKSMGAGMSTGVQTPSTGQPTAMVAGGMQPSYGAPRRLNTLGPNTGNGSVNSTTPANELTFGGS